MFYRKDKLNCETFLKAALNHIPFIVYDLETTGLKSDTDEIVQFSADKYEVKNGYYEKTDSLNLYIKPKFPMLQEVIEVHGISNEFLENKPEMEEVFPIIKNFMNLEECVITGYNTSKFDNKFLEHLYKKNGLSFSPLIVTDIFKMAQELIDINMVKEKKMKLSHVAEILLENAEANFHNAMEDIRITWQVGMCLCSMYAKQKQESMEDRPIAVIKQSWRFNKSHNVNRVYFKIWYPGAIQDEQIYYDIKYNGLYDKDDSVLSKINKELLWDRAFDEMLKCNYVTQRR